MTTPRFGPELIVIDTREQDPFDFPKAHRAALRAGDYSIVGLEDQVALERKREHEIFGNVGRYRERFLAELEKLQHYRYAALIIEGTLSGIVRGCPRSHVHPRSVTGSLVAWSVRYGVGVWFAENHRMAAALAYRILERCWQEEVARPGSW